jgi:HNH endonuclease
LPPIHVYRTEYEELERQILEEDFEPERWNQIVALAQNLREKYQAALKADSIDNRHPLEPARAAWFRARVERFNPDNHPNEIPDTFTEAECNVFGHICPVFFAAEALTETKDTRRIGRRAVSFATMMRIVRRDDYRCQHCKKRLQDDEVEFDHIIPVSKGGSSEEHNLRLTCFDCNRDKSDKYIP